MLGADTCHKVPIPLIWQPATRVTPQIITKWHHMIKTDTNIYPDSVTLYTIAISLINLWTIPKPYTWSLRTIKTTTISFNTIVPSDSLATLIMIAFPHFYYVIDLYEAIAYNQPHTDPTPFIQHSKNYQTSLQQFRPLQPIQPTVHNYRYIDVEIGSIHPCLVQCLPWNIIPVLPKTPEPKRGSLKKY